MKLCAFERGHKMLFFDVKIKKFKKRENSGKNKQKHLNLQKYEKKFKIFLFKWNL